MTDTVRRDVELGVSLQRAWQAVTDPRWLASWLADEVELDLRVGGEACFEIAGERLTGWVEEVCPPSDDRAANVARLAFWWGPADGPASRVEFELRGDRRTTRLRVTETRPLEILDLVGVPLGGSTVTDTPRYGPSLAVA